MTAHWRTADDVVKLLAMVDETGKGAWMWRITVREGHATERERCWDPDATPMSEADYREVLSILFDPDPNDP
ncbi:hypothetical protein [Streptomyces sp. NPDC059828]|uniref:hypothetical protein n=1 Tax=Streptomyces sp. NPDC059828 TaxID=3346965 RepID=UPI0036635BDF